MNVSTDMNGKINNYYAFDLYPQHEHLTFSKTWALLSAEEILNLQSTDPAELVRNSSCDFKIDKN